MARAVSAEVTIHGIASDGAGVGRLPDGRALFVHRTAPGERARVEVTRSRPRWARGRLVELLESSPARRVAPCPHYERCGGCSLEHLDYAAQLRAKAAIAAETLARVGGLALAAPAVEPSPREFRYRNRVTFTLRRLARGRVVAGFHALEEPDRIVDLDGRCLLPEEAIAAGWQALRESWGEDAALLPAGRQLRLTLRATLSGALALLVEGGSGDGEPAGLLQRVPGLRSVWRVEAGGVRLLAGEEELGESWSGEEVRLRGGAFMQGNREAAALLEAYVHGVIGAAAGLRVVDAYCGVGLHARRLARAGASVTGVELDAGAVAEARRAAPAARFIGGTVEDHLEGLLPADLVILNPPRTGIAAEVAALLGASPPRRIVYISCNAATLARDLRRLEAAFEVADLRCFDLFPQTAHVETVATLLSRAEREKSA
jgi:23S rRNA (uracil1939-C5)-methyltransferase